MDSICSSVSLGNYFCWKFFSEDPCIYSIQFFRAISENNLAFNFFEAYPETRWIMRDAFCILQIIRIAKVVTYRKRSEIWRTIGNIILPICKMTNLPIHQITRTDKRVSVWYQLAIKHTKSSYSLIKFPSKLGNELEICSEISRFCPVFTLLWASVSKVSIHNLS